jgi:tetratricopeptide (TPR) repeat protein
LGEQEQAAVRHICQRLDGLPLAIELAAARARVLSPTQIATRLDDALGLLTSRQRGGPARHQTLHAALDWSYRLLDDSEKQMLAGLSVFAGGFTLEAAQHIAVAGAASALDCLTALVEKSLVVVEYPGVVARYRLLETVRQYAAERLAETGATQAMRQRHAEYFLGLAESSEPKMFSPERAAWMERLDLERANLRAALDWFAEQGAVLPRSRLLGALIWYWHLRGWFSEWRPTFEVAVQSFAVVGSPVSPEVAPVLAKLTWGAGHFAWGQGDYVAARAGYEASLRLFRQNPPTDDMVHAVSTLGMVALSEGHLNEAEALTAEAVTLARAGGWGWALALTLYNTGAVKGAQGDIDGSRRLIEESLTRFSQLGDRWGRSIALLYLGLLAAREAKWESALSLVTDCLGLARSEADDWGTVGALALLGEVQLRAGDVPAAQASLLECVRLIVDRVGDRATLAIAWHGLGQLARSQGDPARAVRLLSASQTLQQSAGGVTPMTLTSIDGLAAEVAALRREVDEAAFDAAWRSGQALALAPDEWLD